MRQKSKDLGPDVMAIDGERRLCLNTSVQRQFGVRPSSEVYLTLNEYNTLLVFRDLAALRNHAHMAADNMPGVSKTDAESLFIGVMVRARLDGRGRVVIPNSMLKKAGLRDSALVKVAGDYLWLADPEEADRRREEIRLRMLRSKGLDGGA